MVISLTQTDRGGKPPPRPPRTRATRLSMGRPRRQRRGWGRLPYNIPAAGQQTKIPILVQQYKSTKTLARRRGGRKGAGLFDGRLTGVCDLARGLCGFDRAARPLAAKHGADARLKNHVGQPLRGLGRRASTVAARALLVPESR